MRPVKQPKFLEVRGLQFLFVDPPFHWSESRHGELTCSKCQRVLTVFFEGRNNPGVTEQDAQWWVPTGVTCQCLAPHSVPLCELPKKPHRPRQDSKQLELLTLETT
jgi:hypothetical protein